jgi:hypothetical protein
LSWDRAARKTSEAGGLTEAWYNFGRAAPIAGHRDVALDYLRQSIENGFSNLDAAASDPDLKSLQDDPRFDALLAKARQALPRGTDNRRGR